MEDSKCDPFVLALAKALVAGWFFLAGNGLFEHYGKWPALALGLGALAGAFQVRILASAKARAVLLALLAAAGAAGVVLAAVPVGLAWAVVLAAVLGAGAGHCGVAVDAMVLAAPPRSPVAGLACCFAGLALAPLGSLPPVAAAAAAPAALLVLAAILGRRCREAGLGTVSRLNGTEAVFDGRRKLNLGALLKMRAPRLAILLAFFVALGAGALAGALRPGRRLLVMLVSFSAGSLMFGLFERKAPRALLLCVSSLMLLFASLLLSRMGEGSFGFSVMESLLGLGLGGVVCLFLGLALFASRALAIMLDGFETTLLAGAVDVFFLAGFALGFRLAVLWAPPLFCGALVVSLAVLLALLTSSRVLASEDEANAYLEGGGGAVVEKEKLTRVAIRQPDEHKRPPAWLYFPLALGIKALCRFHFGMRIARKIRIKGPALILTNHVSNYDFLFVVSACFPARINFLATYYWFTFKNLRPWLRYMGVIQKYQFATDITAMKKLRYVVRKKNGVSFIAPEGTIYANGKSSHMSPSIVKIARFLGVPVYAIKIEGASLGHGKWQKVQQKDARVQLTMSRLLSAEEVRTLPSDQMFSRIRGALAYDEFEWQKRTGFRYKGPNKAEGLENLLYKCPSCGRELTLRTQGNRIWCEACGLEARVNESYRFDWPGGRVWFDNYSQWFDFQYDALWEEMRNPDFEMSARVRYQIDVVDTDGFVDAGEGTLRLSLRDGWRYEGTMMGRRVVEEDSLASVPLAVMKMGCHIELPFKGGHSRCFWFLDDGRLSQKWHIASRIVTEKILQPR